MDTALRRNGVNVPVGLSVSTGDTPTLCRKAVVLSSALRVRITQKACCGDVPSAGKPTEKDGDDPRTWVSQVRHGNRIPAGVRNRSEKLP